MVGGMPQAKHPLVATNRTHTATDLIGERLKAELMIGLGQRAGQGIARSLAGLCLKKRVDRLHKPAGQQVFIAPERNLSRLDRLEHSRQVVSVDRREKKQGADSVVQVIGGATKLIQGNDMLKQFIDREPLAERIERLITGRIVF